MYVIIMHSISHRWSFITHIIHLAGAAAPLEASRSTPDLSKVFRKVFRKACFAKPAVAKAFAKPSRNHSQSLLAPVGFVTIRTKTS